MGHWVVVMTARTLVKLDSDNLATSMKYFRDEVARFLDVDDEDPRIKFVCAWKKARGKHYGGVEIRFLPLSAPLARAKAALERELALLGAE